MKGLLIWLQESFAGKPDAGRNDFFAPRSKTSENCLWTSLPNNLPLCNMDSLLLLGPRKSHSQKLHCVNFCSFKVHQFCSNSDQIHRQVGLEQGYIRFQKVKMIQNVWANHGANRPLM